MQNNQALFDEMMKIVENNATFQDAMSDIKEEFFIDDSVHGILHNRRVALLACYIGIKEGLDNRELRLVLETAKYHDIGRGFGGNHGQGSATIIGRNKGYIFPNLSEDDINIIKALCSGHSVEDEKYEEIANLYEIRDIEKFKKLLDIVKDADALDRVRLIRFGKLDRSYLRTQTSKGMVELAEILFSKYDSSQERKPAKEEKLESKYEFSTDLREQVLFDGENYYLLRSLNKEDIEQLSVGNGISPKKGTESEYTIQDIVAQVKMQHKKTNLISMSEDPNVVLTYDKSNLHRFVLIRLSKNEIEDPQKVFSVGEYLLSILDYKLKIVSQKAPENVKQILERVDNASSVEEIKEIINGADRQVPVSLIESRQQYLSEEGQLAQSKKIAKYKVLNYYGLIRGVVNDEKGKLMDISDFTGIMRMGYSSSEWLHPGKIEKDKIISVPQFFVDSLALLKQAEFQGKEKEILRKIEQELLRLVASNFEINKDNYQLEYSLHDELKNDLTIEKALEITGGQISYRDTNMQLTAIRSLAEMILNKREIIKFLHERFPDVDVQKLLSGTYCINQEMITRQNNRGSQIGKNISFLISDYGYDFDNETSEQLLQNVENLSSEQLKDIISKGIDSKEIGKLLIKIRAKDERIQTKKSKGIGSSYIAEAIVEGYNWKKDGNTLKKSEKEALADSLLRGAIKIDELYKLYRAISKMQIGKNKFTQNEIFAIIINIVINRGIGDIQYSSLLKKDVRSIQDILLENQGEIQTTVLPISIDLLVGNGKEISKLKKEFIDLGLDEEFINSKDVRNIYVAKQIVEKYDFGRELTKEEKKVILKAILNNGSLNKSTSVYLAALIQNMEQVGLSEQEIYGMIINLGINGNALGETGYGYTKLLANENNVRQIIAQRKDEIQTKVTEGTILKAKADSLSQEDINKTKEDLIALGIDEKFIDLKDEKNIYVAKQIVEKYDFRRELTKEEKRAMLKAILNNFLLNKNKPKCLVILIQNMEQIGLNEQEIYGMIINLGINGNALGEAGYDYSRMLQNTSNVRQTIAQYKDKIQTKITESTILKAKASNLTQEDINEIKREFTDLGIEGEFLNSKDERNLYLAKEIIDKYNFGRDLTTEERKGILKAILNNSELDKRGTLATFIQSMEQIGLKGQEIYGMIINLGVNGYVIERKGYNYTYLLRNLNNVCQTLAQYKDEIQTKVTEGTILKAKADSLSQEDINKTKEDLIALGIDEKFIDLKDEKNIYVAKQIVEKYDFRRELTKEERKAILKSILNCSKLNKRKSCYLTILIQDMKKIGLKEQEIYGMIINLGINGMAMERTGYDYTHLLANANNVCQTITKYKNEIQTKVTEGTILKAKADNLNQEETDKIKEELIALGINKEFINSKDERNLYVAKEIVDKYNFGRELTREEKKGILEVILNNGVLNKRSALTTLIQYMEKIDLKEQEIYGMIINLGINRKILDEPGYDYVCLLNNINNACQTIKQYKDKIQTQVTEGTILKARSKVIEETTLKVKFEAKSITLTKEDVDKLKREFIDLGLEQEFFDSKDVRNIYVSREIVDKYDFGRELTKKERKVILKAVLSNSELNKSDALVTLIQQMEQIGLDKQEIYGMIINLGVNGYVIERKGYNYTYLLRNLNNVCQTLAQYKDKIQTKVTEGTILKAKSDNLNQEEINKIKEELIDLGIDEKFIDLKNEKNIYVAKQIVEKYNFRRNLTKEERKAILKAILNNSLLNKNKSNFLVTLIQDMEQIGLNEQEIYGMIINLGINEKVIKKSGYSYTRLLQNANDVCQTIAQYKDEIQTEVEEEIIQKAVKKANKPRKIRGQDIAKAGLEITVQGRNGICLCEFVQTDYQRLLHEGTIKRTQKRSEQHVPD